MAISPVTGAIYANQVAPAASAIQGEQQAKFDMQSALAAAAASEQKKEVEETRATDEIYKTDPERNKQEQKNAKQEKKKKDEKELSLDEIDEKLGELRQNEEESEKHFFNFSV